MEEATTRVTGAELVAGMWLETDSILKVEQQAFLMDWWWGMGKKELVTLVWYPLAIYLCLMCIPSQM